jgi:hypothetical protein
MLVSVWRILYKDKVTQTRAHALTHMHKYTANMIKRTPENFFNDTTILIDNETKYNCLTSKLIEVNNRILFLENEM